MSVAEIIFFNFIAVFLRSYDVLQTNSKEKTETDYVIMVTGSLHKKGHFPCVILVRFFFFFSESF